MLFCFGLFGSSTVADGEMLLFSDLGLLMLSFCQYWLLGEQTKGAWKYVFKEPDIVPCATAPWMASVSNLTFALAGVPSIFSQTRVTSFRHGVISS